ncbi:hypothetical protein [Pararhizobium sp. IMCC21322]|uniref:virion core protein, T7 gp14 family n=1 Tax=Pararhizobium sp. IMCC21322 TaxID=3067903 RepID=UPI0027411983|nr:hypothetical protein [Pararhizobium sp. IMCC21322]
MCGPMEIGAAITLAGGAMQGVSGYQQQKAMAAQSQANADLLKRQALLERDKTSYEGAQHQKSAQRLAAKQVASASASGFQVDGSTLDFIESAAAESDLDLQAIRYGGQIQANNLEHQSQQRRYDARSQSKGAGLAFISPIIRSAASFGRGFATS